MRLFAYVSIVLVLGVSLIVAGCGGGAAAPTGEEVKVSMKDMAFKPKELTIKAGTKVTWVNDDVVDHSAVHTGASKALFSSGDFGAGKSFSHLFDKSGTYQVTCTTPGHADAGMKMTVVVQ